MAENHKSDCHVTLANLTAEQVQTFCDWMSLYGLTGFNTFIAGRLGQEHIPAPAGQFIPDDMGCVFMPFVQPAIEVSPEQEEA